MPDTRIKAITHLRKVVGEVPLKLMSSSKFFESNESWTQKETWWFNLPIKKLKENKEKDYYLLGALNKQKNSFVILKVPNNSLIENLRSFETRYDNKIILHLAAYKENWLVDERGKGKVDFSRFEIK